MVFKHKAKKISLQTTIPENLDNNEDTRRDLHGSNLHGKQKAERQDLLSKLGAWGLWGRVEGRGEAGRGKEKNVELNKINLKK